MRPREKNNIQKYFYRRVRGAAVFRTGGALVCAKRKSTVILDNRLSAWYDALQMECYERAFLAARRRTAHD